MLHETIDSAETPAVINAAFDCVVFPMQYTTHVQYTALSTIETCAFPYRGLISHSGPDVIWYLHETIWNVHEYISMRFVQLQLFVEEKEENSVICKILFFLNKIYVFSRK